MYLPLSLALSVTRTQVREAYCFNVQEVGKGRPVILIPGLTCTGHVWDGTVAHLKDRFRFHVLTLPGFGTQPPIEGPYLARVESDLIKYVKTNRLNHPAVIGHSLGGFLTYKLAIDEPRIWGPMISVDGLPFLGQLFNPSATAESMKPFAESFSKQLAAMNQDQFRVAMKANLSQQITDPKNVEEVLATAGESNPSEVAEAAKELFSSDLRKNVAAIRSHFLLLGAGQSASTDASKRSLMNTYAMQIKLIPHCKLEMDYKARHFIMLDDPEFFYAKVAGFLGSGK